MTFLDKETELLLEECIENSSEYPRVLAEKFKGLSAIVNCTPFVRHVI
ncbi:MAG: hypothetical protein IJH64_09285 [Oscillospiraceae bacterium]|nr:hypothetical protein [Oscillospiraceae bacterium]